VVALNADMTSTSHGAEHERIVPGTPHWDASYPDHIQRYEFARARIRPQAHVLDAGCGAGYGSAALADAGAARVIAVDIAAEALDLARRHFDRPNVTWLEDDCHTLERAAGHAPFDAIINFENIEHLARPADFVARAAALLRPDGLLITSTPNRTLINRLRGVTDAAASANPFHLSELNENEFRTLLERRFSSVQMWYQSPEGGERRRMRLRARAARLGLLPLLRAARRMLGRPAAAGAAAGAPARAWRIDAANPGDDVAWTLIAVCRNPRP
jgi:SAM-dependent methyltransferase